MVKKEYQVYDDLWSEVQEDRENRMHPYALEEAKEELDDSEISGIKISIKDELEKEEED